MSAAGVVDQNVQILPSADFLPRPEDKFFDAGRLCDIQKMKMRLPCPGFPCFSGDFFQAINAPGAEQQLGAFRAKCPGRRRAKPGRRAGDENPFILQR